MEDGGYTLCADTIFSALCQECLKQGAQELERLVSRAREGKIRVTDAFPFIGDDYYLPKPMLKIEKKEQQGDSTLKKAYKKLSYVPARGWKDYIDGNLDVIQELNRFQKGLGRREIKVSASIRGMEETTPYRVGIYRFWPESGLYLIAGGETRDEVLCPGAAGWLAALRAPAWLSGLIVDGLISGVGGVLTFLPMIALLFLFLSMLEDSGYMARAAFVMDRTLRHFGLSGKAFIPMLMGFGCTVPAVMGARTMENEKDRRMTILLVPFMSCGARLPIYGLMTSAFFPERAGLVVFCLYLLGPVMAIVSGLILKRSVFRGEPAPFLLELPPYRMPTLHNIWLHVWERVRDFLTRAGTVIAFMSVAVWFLQNFSFSLRMVENTADSVLAQIGGLAAPVFAPMGFGTWQAAVALLTGLIAKEAVVSSMSLFYGFSLTDYAAAGAAMSATFSPAAALAFLAFCALYTPCVAAIATIRRAMNSRSWTALALIRQLGVAWLASYAVYQIAVLVL